MVHVTAVIMVKNEENTILTTLNSLSSNFINRIIVHDTGSTDRTVKQCIEWRDENTEIPLHVTEGPWTNFAESRNDSLCSCEGFADSDWILHLDANDETRLAQGYEWKDVKSYLFSESTTTAQLVHRHLLMKDDTIKFKLGRLHRLRSNPQWKFSGPVHEILTNGCPDGPDGSGAAMDVCPGLIVYQDREDDFKKTLSRGRFEWDVKVLKEEIEKKPHSSRSWFYLGTTLQHLKKHEEALAAFSRRCELSGGFLPESYLARLHCGDLCHQMGRCEEAILWYLRASCFAEEKMKPRAEGMFAIGFLMEQLGHNHLAFQFMRASCDADANDIAGSFNNKLYTQDRWAGMARTAKLCNFEVS